MLARIKAKEKEEDKPDLFKEINGVSYVLEEHADEIGIIIKAMDKVKAADNPQEMLGLL